MPAVALAEAAPFDGRRRRLVPLRSLNGDRMLAELNAVFATSTRTRYSPLGEESTRVECAEQARLHSVL